MCSVNVYLIQTQLTDFMKALAYVLTKKNTEIGLLTSKLTLYGNVSGKLSPSRLVYHLHSSVL